MTLKAAKKTSDSASALVSASGVQSLNSLLDNLRAAIQKARQQVFNAVDIIQVRASWEVGRHIVEFEQGGDTRAEYGKNLLQQVSAQLTAEFGKGFDASNLRYMRLFYRAFPICDALRHELSWTVRVEEAAA